jgi:glycogen debranching enzyme
MRCWGRDTFIAFTGLFLVTKRFHEAKQCILDFASVVRNGLVPNLFDNGINPRYNARDATWCFLHAVCNYCEYSHDTTIFDAFVTGESTLAAVIESILDQHIRGIDFVEVNAGPQIDQFMQPPGFRVTVSVETRSGLVIGGNSFNCGTWMDKMGSAESNRGVPATSRYGANIEINALVLRVLDWLVEKGSFSKYVAWRDALKKSFDSEFWNPSIACYSDTVLGDPKEQRLRPNGLLALSVIPRSALDLDHVKKYLTLCEESLLGPLGMRTLPASDPDFNGVYDNRDASGGYNYHNGPEWVWLFAYFVIACRRFNYMSKSELLVLMEKHDLHISTDKWRSLPELTNMNGQFCPFSCPSQAWSVCCLLEALNYLESNPVD